jgi:hypothetical protein
MYTTEVNLIIQLIIYFVANKIGYIQLLLGLARAVTLRSKSSRRYSVAQLNQRALSSLLITVVRVNYKPILSSERVTNTKKPAIVRQRNVWS